MRSLCIALLVATLVPASAWAGGDGGTKPSSTLLIKNLGTALLAVIVNPPANLNVNNLDAFRAQGGKTLNAGESTTFKVRAGNQVLTSSFINVVAGAPGPIGNTDVAVGKNRTVKLNVAGTPAAAPTVTAN